jgi:hypothetical protein
MNKHCGGSWTRDEGRDTKYQTSVVHRLSSIICAFAPLQLRLVLALLLCAGSLATGEVSTTVYFSDANTPLEPADPNIPFIYRDVMVGTKLTIIVSSDANEGWSGALQIVGTNRDYGAIPARDYNDITLYLEGSHLEAAGICARVNYTAGYLATSVNLSSSSDGTAVPGDWFIIDYTATNVGNCTVSLHEPIVPSNPGYDGFNPPPASDFILHELVFSHVPTRDFTGDVKVNFADFAIFASFKGVTNCAELNWCEGTDLDVDGDVDNDDLMLFADYWLESTE